MINNNARANDVTSDLRSAFYKFRGKKEFAYDFGGIVAKSFFITNLRIIYIKYYKIM